MIINIRGTHGSGKSTLVRSLINRYKGVPLDPVKGKPAGYRLIVPWLTRGLYVVGSYETACGGCDGIQPYALIWPRVEDYAALGHVLFEGALVSSSYGNIGRASEKYGDAFVFAFMNTPLKTCLGWIAARRAARGVEKPLNPANTVHKYESIMSSIPKIRDEFGRRVVVIDHRKAVPQVLGLLLKAERE